MSDMNLQKTLKKIVLFSCCMTVLLLGITFFVTQMYKNTVNNATEKSLQEEVNIYKERIVNQIDYKFQIINSMAGLIGTSNMPQEEIFRKAFLTADSQNKLLMLGYWDAVNNKLFLAAENGELKVVSESEIQDEIWDVLEGTLKGKNVVSDLLEGEISKKNILVLGTPVYHEGEIIGAILAGDRIDVYGNMLNEQRKLYGSGYMHLIDNEGDFIVRSEEAAVKEELTGILQQPYMDEKQAEQIKKDMKEEKVVHFHFYYDGEEYDTLLEPVGINGWYLFCVNSIKNVNRNIYALVDTVVIFFVVIIAIFFFTLCYGYRTMKKLNCQLQKMAYYDELTGIYNMQYFTKIVEKQAEKQEDYAIMVLNVRHFKFVNEFFRRAEADNLLKHIGRVLTESIGETEYACRENSDYFYLFLNDTDHKVLEERFEGISRKIAEMTGKANKGFRIVMRSGVATTKHSRNIQDVLIHAVFALAKTKEDTARNLWFFDTELHLQEQKKGYIENRAQKALEDGEFKLYLQPKVSLKDDSLVGAEALVRWVEKNGNMMNPGEFIPLFETNGFCIMLDMYMFEKVCQQLRAWIDAGYEPVPISVNQSKLVFYENNYVERLRYCLELYQVPASLITLEILEGLAVENVEEMNKKLERLRAIGFKISMDDFGTGYSSLNTFCKLKLDEVKLDRGFLVEKRQNEEGNTHVIMEEVVRMAKRLSLSTVVEGIETEEEDVFVKQIGADEGQGYLYSRPVSAEVFTTDILPIKEARKTMRN